MEPVATSRLGVPSGGGDKRGGNTLALLLTSDLGIKEEGVIASVPRHVDEADQATTWQAGGHPAKAVRPDLIPPSGRRPTAMCRNQRQHFRIGDWPTPAVLNRLGHMPDRPATRRWRQRQDIANDL